MRNTLSTLEGALARRIFSFKKPGSVEICRDKKASFGMASTYAKASTFTKAAVDMPVDRSAFGTDERA